MHNVTFDECLQYPKHYLEVWGTNMNKIVTVLKELLFVKQPLHHVSLISCYNRLKEWINALGEQKKAINYSGSETRKKAHMT